MWHLLYNKRHMPCHMAPVPTAKGCSMCLPQAHGSHVLVLVPVAEAGSFPIAGSVYHTDNHELPILSQQVQFCPYRLLYAAASRSAWQLPGLELCACLKSLS